ncbi:EmrB/QacA subfamily drug resistance transporter [Streptomyces sp. 3211.6]|uniref:MFS transporter n=1 Tax=Streptomyces sp. 3211.6 TaxID=1938845 RepID=UPI000C2C65F5|nr:MFS transporter [Streptomyces sp. 3211.6]RKT05191.1 EmrB/QacA subfamily drug resistance transporter [Streptomyces sp. 3211.6]
MSTETPTASPERENGPVREEGNAAAAAAPDTIAEPATPDAPADRLRWLALAIVMTASFMDLVDVTIVNIAIPSMRQDFGATTSAIQWITAGYALAFAAGLITGGRLGDIYGRKRLFLVGVAGFTAASLLCGIAPDPGMLVASRLLQGGMAAMMVPQVLAIIHVTFPPHERGKVFGMFGAIVGLGAVSGPLLGALLTEWNLFGLEWRTIFLINLPVGIAAVILGRKFISESKAPKALRLDLIGVVLATLALVLLIYPLTQGRENDWPLWGFACMIASPVVFAVFIAYEKYKIKKDGSPLVELSLFQVKSFAGGITVQLAFGLATGIFFLVWTLYMQMGLGWTPLRAGCTGIPFSIAVSVAAGLSVEKLVPRFGRKVLQAGALVMAAGLLLYIWESQRYGMEIASWQMAAPLVVMGIGMGLIVAPLNDTILSQVPREHAGSASGLINTTGQMGNALGLALTSVVFFGSIDDDRILGAPYVEAFRGALWWVVAVLVVIFAVMFVLPRKQVPLAEREGAVEQAAQA